MPPEKRAKYYESKDKMLTMAAYHSSDESLRATDPRNILEPSKKEKHILELKKEK